MVVIHVQGRETMFHVIADTHMGHKNICKLDADTLKQRIRLTVQKKCE